MPFLPSAQMKGGIKELKLLPSALDRTGRSQARSPSGGCSAAICVSQGARSPGVGAGACLPWARRRGLKVPRTGASQSCHVCLIATCLYRSAIRAGGCMGRYAPLTPRPRRASAAAARLGTACAASPSMPRTPSHSESESARFDSAAQGHRRDGGI